MIQALPLFDRRPVADDRDGLQYKRENLAEAGEMPHRSNADAA
jgi:hypothetical protein